MNSHIVGRPQTIKMINTATNEESTIFSKHCTLILIEKNYSKKIYTNITTEFRTTNNMAYFLSSMSKKGYKPQKKINK